MVIRPLKTTLGDDPPGSNTAELAYCHPAGLAQDTDRQSRDTPGLCFPTATGEAPFRCIRRSWLGKAGT